MACIEYTTQTDSKVYKIKQDIDKCLDESKTGVSSEIVYQIIVCFYSRLFAVQNRNALINKIWEEELYKYITGIVQNKEQKMLAINGTHNHIHFFIGMKPTRCSCDSSQESNTIFITSLL